MRPNRRELIAGGAALAAAPAFAAAPPSLVSKRPPVAERRFVSKAVEAEITRVSKLIADPTLRWMFGNCYPNTLDTTVLALGEVGGKPDAFVITGDIPCLWLRDSAAQLRPYLHLVKRDPALGRLFRGLIGRQARSILIDPYANAFMQDPTARTNLSWALKDDTDMKPGVAERKWEIDSLCYAIRLAHDYWRETGDMTPFDAEWKASARLIVKTFREQQRKEGSGPYHFRRSAPEPTETLYRGYGLPTRPNGMIHSGFRPSDDACLYGQFVPANLFAMTTLREVAALSNAVGESALAQDATTLAAEVEAALRQFGTMTLPSGERVWAYEVDGYGNAVFMDDANVPSLSGLAYLRCVDAADPLWQRTVAACWSKANPWYFEGKALTGIGGPHTGPGQVWPMSIITRALTSSDPALLRSSLAMIRGSHGGTGFIHEGVDIDDPTKFTRDWFAWANGLFGELVVHVAATRPEVLRETYP
ncbi:glycoside hydrolase family 125 protein [Sphingomonas sanguinis]|uniref:Glycoside hydrolase family 125 protein n=1 Tax=Sphingomonas sanguinis TaxID=33051 RepID=A0ABU5LNJ6_9SPHN|nr:glycoside hydrolase family 125 protein [Sphingomonas sanguinis]MDZ7281507.1 glycoside hydrolase family 125 protein [Sphingomonas sanguinis]